MFQIVKEEMMWGGRKLTLETGRIARQADGAVLVSYGNTIVLCTVVSDKHNKAPGNFFPMTVNYQEKSFAAGKIPGGFFKREGRPSEYETLTSRLIDRPIRPLFVPSFRNETQIVCTVLSHDFENDDDVPAMIGASAALTLSGLPFLGPIAAARVGYHEGQYILNPYDKAINASSLDLVVAGTQEGVLMVESEAHELSEDIMLGAVTFGHEAFQPVIDMIIRLAEQAAKDPWELAAESPFKEAMNKRLKELAEDDFRQAYKEKSKQIRYKKLATIRTQAHDALVEEGYESALATELIHDLEYNLVRHTILKTGQRIDGRDSKTVRPIVSEVGILPKAHGSALFTRGETQAMVVATLGSAQDEQIIDALKGEYRENFMLHYNFPAYSVGETGRMGSPGRREIGHGKLAWRAIHPMLPGKDKFPYTIRVVAEITESNGSSSMATVCGTSLALMDAGVLLERPIAGIAMGLIKEGKDFTVLSDILGDEDHLGDMDFKVAGTSKGITSLQMDLKITSITPEIMKIALHQAYEGRLHILEQMSKAISQTRAELHLEAPRIVTMSIAKDRIRDLIGPGGKVIRDICETTGAKIDIDDATGIVSIAAVGGEAISRAMQRVTEAAGDPEVGKIYEGTVVKTMDFGAFVRFFGERDGLVHISELAPQRVANTTDVVKEGEKVRVKVLGFDDRGKVKLSMKQAQETPSPELSPAPQAGA